MSRLVATLACDVRLQYRNGFYWELEAGRAGAWVYFVIGVLYVALLIFLLQRRFERVVQS